MGATGAMMALNSVGTLGTFASQQQQAGAITRQADFSARLADLNAHDAVTRGDQQASARALRGRQMIGAQRAAQAASGVDANTGSAVNVQADEAGLSALDQQIIRNNAAREAWGYRTQGLLDRVGAQNEAANLRAQSYNTLLTGAAKNYGLYANRQKNTTGAPRAQTTGRAYSGDSGYGTGNV